MRQRQVSYRQTLYRYSRGRYRIGRHCTDAAETDEAVSMEGKLVVISGFSGAGKGTVVRRLMEEYGDYVLSISMTTRQPRSGERNGVEYHFVTNEEFEDLVRQEGFLEYAGYVNHYYGTPRAFAEQNMNAGRDVLLEIEVQGAMQIRKRFPEAVLIFVSPRNAQELERRLVGRGTDSAETVTKRLRQALQEISSVPEYPFLVFNDEVETCASDINSLIRGDRGACQTGAGARADVGAAALSGGRILTSRENKEAFSERFEEELNQVLSRRENQER